MRAIVLGGNGFIGSHLVDALLAEGTDVAVYDRAPERYREPLAGVRYISGELGNTKLISSILPGSDVVFHLASTTLPKTSNDAPTHDIQSNLVDTVRLLEACVASQVGKVVFLSSGGTVYGRVDRLPVDEEHPTLPLCSYGIVKLTIERYLHLFHCLYGLDYAVLRPGNPYGERQSPEGIQGAVAVFLGRVAAGQTIEVWGDGEIVRDFFHVSDLARACVLAGHAPNPALVCNVGSGEGLSINELLTRIEALVGRPFDVERQQARALDVPKLVLEIERAKRELGWRPGVALDEGLARSWEWTLDEGRRGAS